MTLSRRGFFGGATASLAATVAALPAADRREALAALTPTQHASLLTDWRFWARPHQLPPAGDWRTWLVLAGRGWGKTRTGAETVRAWAESGQYRRIALIAPTAADVRDVVVEGESGILAIAPPNNRPQYEPSKRRLTWPNGAIATAYSADEPERLRGPQHDAAWADELAAWNYHETWSMLMFGLRLGVDPRVVVTTTPKPLPIIRELLADPTTAVTRGQTYDNRANLAPQFLNSIIRKYEGTRMGRQELLAEVLDDVPGALWTRAMIDAAQVDACGGDLMRVAIGVDPAISAMDESDLTGIVAAGALDNGCAVVLGDYSCRASPQEWATRAVNAFWQHRADVIVAEANQGGDMVRATIQMVDPRVPVELVHASRGKLVRAEPIAALYEQGRVRHVRTAALAQLEDQMCSYSPGSMMKSPDRMDALVWALWRLFIDGPGPQMMIYHDPVMISTY